jgi:hypothetical protein
VDALCAVIDASAQRITQVVRGLEQLGGLEALEEALRLVEHQGSLRLAASVGHTTL